MTRAELEALAVIASAIITLIIAFAAWLALFGLNSGVTGKPWQLVLVASALSIAGFRTLHAHAKEKNND